jgi:hypothetical protein
VDSGAFNWPLNNTDITLFVRKGQRFSIHSTSGLAIRSIHPKGRIRQRKLSSGKKELAIYYFGLPHGVPECGRVGLGRPTMLRTLALNRGTRLSMKAWGARQMRSLEGAFVLASRSEVKYGNGSNSMATIFRSAPWVPSARSWPSFPLDLRTSLSR